MDSKDFSCECIVVGGGIIGLSIAASLVKKGYEVILVESEKQTMQHASSHNSEVIHSGVYYKNNSFKSQFCVEGNHLLYERCMRLGISYKNIGKYIVANSEEDYESLEKLYKNGKSNGVDKLSIINHKVLKKNEPALKGKLALFCGTTGIIDSHSYSLSLEAEIENNGGYIIHNSEVIDGSKNIDSWELSILGPEFYKVKCDLLINASGFNAINLAKKFGAKNLPDEFFVKGYYYKYHAKNPFNHLIYPLPNKHGLGIHSSCDLNNNIRFGPDSDLIDKPNYEFIDNVDRKNKFCKSINNYFHGFKKELLQPDFCGVRVRLHEKHNDSDFLVSLPIDHGIEGLVNLIGIESPGLTSSLAISKYVVDNL